MISPQSPEQIIQLIRKEFYFGVQINYNVCSEECGEIFARDSVINEFNRMNFDY